MNIKELIKKIWQWILDQTDIDEKIESELKHVVKEYKETKQQIKEVKDEVQERVSRVREEVADVTKSFKEVANQVGDIKSAVVGKKRSGRPSANKVTKSSLRSMKKEDLIDLAKTKFKTVLNEDLDKTTLINKVYELHIKK